MLPRIPIRLCWAGFWTFPTRRGCRLPSRFAIAIPFVFPTRRGYCTQETPIVQPLDGQATPSPISAIRGDGAFSFPLRRGCHPAAIFQQSRAKVGPNSYARGDHIRPCYARQRSLKREPLCNGKTERISKGVFPTHGKRRSFCPYP